VRRPLADFLTPIASGLVPTNLGALTPERAAQLEEQLRELAYARGAALEALRTGATRG